jgi:hypothetical protein
MLELKLEVPFWNKKEFTESLYMKLASKKSKANIYQVKCSH